MKKVLAFLPITLMGSFLVSACTVVEAPLSVVGTAVDVTGTVVGTAADVVTYPLRDDD